MLGSYDPVQQYETHQTSHQRSHLHDQVQHQSRNNLYTIAPLQ